MAKKQKNSENYLLRVPAHPAGLEWKADEDGMVTLYVENKGLMNKIAQKLFKKPKISQVHLDEIGSYVWQIIDGEKNLIDLGVPFEEHFGEKVAPTYERLAQFFQILDSYGFVCWVKT